MRTAPHLFEFALVGSHQIHLSPRKLNQHSGMVQLTNNPSNASFGDVWVAKSLNETESSRLMDPRIEQDEKSKVPIVLLIGCMPRFSSLYSRIICLCGGEKGAR
jgi:hypothetical protein